MLKILAPTVHGGQVKAKCGEIFCHSSTEFSIFCTICELKCLAFDDFLLHVQNFHFENNLLKSETIGHGNDSYDDVDVKSELANESTDQLHEEEIWDTLEHTLDEDEFNSGIENNEDDEDDHDSEEEKPIAALRSARKPKVKRKKGKVKNETLSGNEDDDCSDHSSDEDFKPEVLEKVSPAGLAEKNTHCDHCSKSFRNMGHLKIHISKVHNDCDKREDKDKEDNKEQCCLECAQLFPNRKTLDRHINDEHGGFKCSQCEKRFRQRHQRKRHEQSHTAERIYTCNVEGCGKSFTEKYYLKRHIDVHTTDRNFVCDFEKCGKAFHTMRRLRAHQNIHTKPKNLVCDACGYTCRENETLRVHQRVHTGEKPYACEVCEKRFISSSALGEHMASHSTTRPHVCKVCNASFARQKALYHHSFLHSDVKKFKCKICGSAYKQASGLAGHMRKHREDGMISMLPEMAMPPSAANAQPIVATVYPFATV